MAQITMNAGKYDRLARVTLGALLLAYGLVVMGTLGIVLAIIGLVPLLTGLAGWCPLYAVLKFNTCSKDDA